MRYVIDTGLERRARFNHHTNMQELITQSITKSSMRQRTGRAGRVASGICVRLYSADDEAKFIDEPPPAITEANIEQTVLRLVNAQKPDPKTKQAPLPLEMVDPLPEVAVRLAKQRLRMLGLLTEQTIGGRMVDALTSVGSLNLSLGLGVRLGLFLYHCAYPAHSKPCLAAGVYLAAALSSSGHVNLLPLKPLQSAAAAKAVPDTGPSDAPYGFEVETGSGKGKFQRIHDTAVVARLRQLLQDQKPVSYESRGQQYTARVEKGEIVQTNNDTERERKVRQVQTPAAPSWSLWGLLGGSGHAGKPAVTSPFQDSSGDHWTLLRTVKGFVEEAQGSGFNWCMEHNLPLEPLGEAQDVYEHITATLGKLRIRGYDPADDPFHWKDAKKEPPKELKEALLTALCKAYHDQVAVPKKAQDLSHGLIWISENSHEQAQGIRAFAEKRGPHDDNEDEDGDDESTAAPASIAQLLQAKAHIKQQEDAHVQRAAEVKLDRNSTLWQPELALPASNTSQLVLFGSVIQTVRPSHPLLQRVLSLRCTALTRT